MEIALGSVNANGMLKGGNILQTLTVKEAWRSLDV